MILVFVLVVVRWLLLLLVIDIGRRDGVRIVEALSVSRIVVSLHIALLMVGQSGLCWVAGHLAARNGRDDRSRDGMFADAVFHAQLEEDILQSVETVEAQQVLWRLFGKEMTGTH